MSTERTRKAHGNWVRPSANEPATRRRFEDEIAGDVDPETVAAQVERLRGRWPLAYERELAQAVAMQEARKVSAAKAMNWLRTGRMPR